MSPEGKAYGRGQVIEIINSVINKMDETTHDKRDIYLHIAELATTIDSLKREIAESRPDHVGSSHVPDAKDELDEIVKATAVATNNIMGVCEEIEKVASAVESEKSSQITDLVTQIYEACTFQDITGQRIQKVVSTLREIEVKVDRIMDTLSATVGPLNISDDYQERQADVNDEKSLLNGPQMADKAISQEEIDRLLAEFDN